MNMEQGTAELPDPNVNTQAEIYANVRRIAFLDAEQCALAYAIRCMKNGFQVGADVASDIAKELRAMMGTA